MLKFIRRAWLVVGWVTGVRLWADQQSRCVDRPNVNCQLSLAILLLGMRNSCIYR